MVVAGDLVVRFDATLDSGQLRLTYRITNPRSLNGPAALTATPTTRAANCVVMPSWPDTIRAGSPDHAGDARAWMESCSKPLGWSADVHTVTRGRSLYNANQPSARRLFAGIYRPRTQWQRLDWAGVPLAICGAVVSAVANRQGGR